MGSITQTIPSSNPIHKLAVITRYPTSSQNDIRNQNAIAMYAQKTVLPLSNHFSVDVYAEITPHKTKRAHNSSLTVIRSWVWNNPVSLLNTAWRIARDAQVNVVLIQFEFTMFGRTGIIAIFPLLLAILRAAGKRVVWEQHEVLLDVSKLDQHVHITNTLVQSIYNIGFKAYYRIIGLFTSYVIVLEHSLKSRLVQMVNPRKVIHISHVAHTDAPISRTAALSRLNLDAGVFHIMAFGFINWYKGSDWLADTYIRNPITGTRLLLAGGRSPTMNKTPAYTAYYNSLAHRIRTSNTVRLTGYVPDKLVSTYFSASDLIVLPYRYLFAASGPLSLALAYGKPFILSSKLRGYMDNPDFIECMRASDVEEDDLFFELNNIDFTKKVEGVKNNPAYLKKLTKFSGMLGQRRNAEATTRNYIHVLQMAVGKRQARLGIAIA